MAKSTPRTLQSGDFQVNRTWLAYRINQAPVHAEGYEVDIYVLQDAASMYLFGNAFAPHGTEFPDLEAVERLMDGAYSKKNEWPSELLLPGTPGRENTFSKVAREHDILVRSVPESQLSFFIKDVQESYEHFLSRTEGDA
jgi:hypothetical protein